MRLHSQWGLDPRSYARLWRRRAASIWIILSLVVAVSLPGCGPAGPKGPRATVHGKVTLNGSPIASGVMVTFLGETGGAGSGLAGADGSYRLLSQHGDQMPIGKYKVVLAAPSAASSLTPEQEMEASMKAQQSGNPSPPPPTSGIPAKYSNPTTTTETREVKEGDNEINIDLSE